MTDTTLKDQVIAALKALLDDPGDTVPRYKVYQALEPIVSPKAALSDEPAIAALDDMLSQLWKRSKDINT